MRHLIETLYALDDVKRLAPYRGQTGDVLRLEARLRDTAASVQERVMRYAVQYVSGVR